jgi:signal transduction histidine kinase
MNRRTMLSLMLTLALPGAVWARATREQAEALVKKAIELYKKKGRDAALQEFARADGGFIDHDLYIIVHTMDGLCLAHVNPPIRGKNMIEERDLDGKYFTRERLEAAHTQSNGWQEYKYFNPESHKIELKRTYWEKHDNLVFACGAYRSLLASM